MVRDIVYGALGIKSLAEGFTLVSVPADRLQKFLDDDEDAGPKLHGTYLDLTGDLTARRILKNPWNQVLVSRLAKVALHIKTKAKGWFGEKSLDMETLLRDRIYRFILVHWNARPRDKETEEDRLQRIMSAYEEKIVSSKATGILHLVSAFSPPWILFT